MQLSLLNFVSYNVAGGGDSALYGVESSHFYLLNGLLNFNIALPLALAYPVIVALQAVGLISHRPEWRIALSMSPLVVWLASISALPHKEERFLYVVYPLVCHPYAFPESYVQYHYSSFACRYRFNRDQVRQCVNLPAGRWPLLSVPVSYIGWVTPKNNSFYPQQ